MIVLLSHRLTTDQPNWPGAPGMTLRPEHQMSRGDVADTHVISIYSHYGTHCDLPSHFIPGGSTLSDLTADRLVFTRPVVLDIELADDALLTADDLRAHADLLSTADLVMIRSGFQRHRGDHARYESHGPGFTEEAAQFLRDTAPDLRGVAIDWLSVCAGQHVDHGVAAHRRLLDEEHQPFLLIVEDVDLAALGGATPSRVFVTPLLIDSLDGSPCTILAEV
ncbi:cyclase family protein [Streptomyces sioyaensis]|uniref:cyclase family protein n=1 Tax=Streptomyces sioyaensis TaxID=67364 RepID=UPI003D737CFF